MKPDGRRGSTNVENHLNPRLVHLLQNLIEPGELKLPLRRLEGIPGEVAHANQGEAGLLHQRNILTDLFG